MNFLHPQRAPSSFYHQGSKPLPPAPPPCLLLQLVYPRRPCAVRVCPCTMPERQRWLVLKARLHRAPACLSPVHTEAAQHEARTTGGHDYAGQPAAVHQACLLIRYRVDHACLSLHYAAQHEARTTGGHDERAWKPAGRRRYLHGSDAVYRSLQRRECEHCLGFCMCMYEYTPWESAP